MRLIKFIARIFRKKQVQPVYVRKTMYELVDEKAPISYEVCKDEQNTPEMFGYLYDPYTAMFYYIEDK